MCVGCAGDGGLEAGGAVARPPDGVRTPHQLHAGGRPHDVPTPRPVQRSRTAGLGLRLLLTGHLPSGQYAQQSSLNNTLWAAVSMFYCWLENE